VVYYVHASYTKGGSRYCIDTKSMAYSPGGPGSDPLLVTRIQRIFFRKVTLTDLILDFTVCAVMTTLVVIQNMVGSALLFDQLHDSWDTWAFWKIYLPPRLNLILLPWMYATVMYHLFPLLGAFVISCALFGFIGGIFWFWLAVDWFDCKNVLWCANLRYWSTDPVTGAKIFGPLINGTARWEFIVFWVVSGLCLAGIGALVYLSITLYSVLYYRNRALMKANTSMPDTDVMESY